MHRDLDTDCFDLVRAITDMVETKMRVKMRLSISLL